MAQSVPACRSKGKIRIRLARANSWCQMSVTAVAMEVTTGVTAIDEGVTSVVAVEPAHSLPTSFRSIVVRDRQLLPSPMMFTSPYRSCKIPAGTCR